jgi:hypothetical protein
MTVDKLSVGEMTVDEMTRSQVMLLNERTSFWGLGKRQIDAMS